MTVDSGLLQGASWALGAVFVLSAAEKAQALRLRSAAWHPVMLISQRRRERATVLMAVGLAADLAIVALLAVSPRVGGPVAALLLLTYTWLAWPIAAHGGSCRCLWRVLDVQTQTALLCRNAALVVVALVTGVASPSAPRLEPLLYAAALLLALAALVRWLNARARRPVQEFAESASALVPRAAVGPDQLHLALSRKGGSQEWS